jgi:hypothetical protein
MNSPNEKKAVVTRIVPEIRKPTTSRTPNATPHN